MVTIHDLCAECPQNLECDSNGANCQCREGFSEESECCDCEDGYYQNGTSCISKFFGCYVSCAANRKVKVQAITENTS